MQTTDRLILPYDGHQITRSDAHDWIDALAAIQEFNNQILSEDNQIYVFEDATPLYRKLDMEVGATHPSNPLVCWFNIPSTEQFGFLEKGARTTWPFIVLFLHPDNWVDREKIAKKTDFFLLFELRPTPASILNANRSLNASIREGVLKEFQDAVERKDQHIRIIWKKWEITQLRNVVDTMKKMVLAVLYAQFRRRTAVGFRILVDVKSQPDMERIKEELDTTDMASLVFLNDENPEFLITPARDHHEWFWLILTDRKEPDHALVGWLREAMPGAHPVTCRLEITR